MTAQLAHIRRHPIKSIGGEGLERVTLTPARRLPGDREWAVLTEAGERNARSSETDGAPDRWLPKACFVRGVSSPPIQAVKGSWQGGRIRLRHPEQPDLDFDPVQEGDKLVEWLRPLWPENAPPPTRLVKGAAIWTDQKWPWVSILSLDSLAALEARTGQRFGIERWRGNLWVKGWEPFAERELIGRTFHIGPVELRVTQHITRCEATSANTDTGRTDIDMLGTLSRLYGHTDFGVFAEIISGGEISIGDPVA